MSRVTTEVNVLFAFAGGAAGCGTKCPNRLDN